MIWLVCLGQVVRSVDHYWGILGMLQQAVSGHCIIGCVDDDGKLYKLHYYSCIILKAGYTS